jgi:hypothetical protein
MKAGARELDPRRSGLYVRYHLMIAYLLEKQKMALDEVLAASRPREGVETQLMTLSRW